jgi:DNA-binding GntR family transcriptional regulator
MAGEAPNKTDMAYRMLRKRLETGELEPGQRLTETAIARELGISRIPVREAMSRLGAEGVIKSKGPYGGKYVEFIEDQQTEDIIYRYELREIVEGQAARLAAMNMTGRQIAELRQFVDELPLCDKAGDVRKRGGTGGAFHTYIVANGGNPLLFSIWPDYHLLPFSTRSIHTEEQIQSRLGGGESNAEKPRHIVDAIASHDPDLAEVTVREQISEVTEAIRAVRSEEAN